MPTIQNKWNERQKIKRFFHVWHLYAKYIMTIMPIDIIYKVRAHTRKKKKMGQMTKLPCNPPASLSDAAIRPSAFIHREDRLAGEAAESVFHLLLNVV